MSTGHLLRNPLIFLTLSVALSGWLVLLNSPHEGINASLHWDTEASITYGPHWSKTEFAAARAHLFDCLSNVRSTDPAQITRYYWTEPALKYHTDLSVCRYYYTAIADWIGHETFEWGRRKFHTPLAAVWTYQLTAAGAMAVALAVLATAGLVSNSRATVWVTLVATAAISSSPIVLSVSRQWLTETPGFVCFVLTIACVEQALKFSADGADRLRRRVFPTENDIAVSEKNRRRSRPAQSLLLALIAGALAFATIRSRYTMGPALAIVLPVVALLRPVPPRRSVGLLIAFLVPIVGLTIRNIALFGPFILPGVYDEVMVRSSRLFFHSDQPYDPFMVALWENVTLLLVPLIVVWHWITTGRRDVAARSAGALAIAVVAVMLWRTAAQQVLFQGRHLFPLASAGIALMYAVLPRIRWRPTPLIGFTAIALFLTVWNICGTFGAQRRHETTGQADVIQVVSKHLSPEGANMPRSLFRDLWWTDYDWSDGRVLRDTLLVWRAVADQNAVLLVDDAAANANQFAFYAREFPAFLTVRLHGCTDRDGLLIARDAIAHGRPAYLMTAPGRRPPADVMESAVVPGVDLHAAALRRVSVIR